MKTLVQSRTSQTYKDVENKLEYKTEDLLKLHNNILAILKQMTIFYEKRDKEIKAQDETSDIGFSITSFIDTLSYENRTLYEQINLYNSYLQFYHSSQNSYLDKTVQKMDTFMNDIEKEIMTNHKNIKTKSMNKFNIIKEKFNNGTLINALKLTECHVKERENVEIKPHEIKPHEIKPHEIKPDEIKPHEIKPDEIKPLTISTNEIIKTNQDEDYASENDSIPEVNQYSSDNNDIIIQND